MAAGATFGLEDFFSGLLQDKRHMGTKAPEGFDSNMDLRPIEDTVQTIAWIDLDSWTKNRKVSCNRSNRSLQYIRVQVPWRRLLLN